MTKTEAKKALKEIFDRLADIRADLWDLQAEIQDTADSIEPYEGKDELNPQQEERQEWFEETATILDDLVEAMANAECEIEDKGVTLQ